MAEIPVTSITLIKTMGEDFHSRRWDEFLVKYEPAMQGFVQQQFLNVGLYVDMQEAIQDTMIALTRILPEYRYDPDEKGHFRDYLMGVLRNKCREQIKARCRQAAKVEHIKTVEGSRTDEKFERSQAELRDFRLAAYETALMQLRNDPNIQRATWTIFEHVALRGEAPEAVAAAFGVTRNNVDQIRSRLTAKLRKLAKDLEGM